MRNQRRWRFGEIEIVTSEFAFLASEVSQIKRIESINQFTFLLGQWLGNPGHRSALVDIDREVRPSGAGPRLGRALGREYDATLVASLQSAFQSRRLHVVRIVGPLASRFGSATVKSWKFEGAQIVQANSVLGIRELVEFFHIKGAADFSRDLGRWLAKPALRRTVLDLHKTIQSRPTDQDHLSARAKGDTSIVEDLVAAWENRELYLLRRRVSGGNGDEEAFLPTVSRGTAISRSSQVKTWIEIKLKDQNDKPAAGVRYRLRISDGSFREGMLDNNGSIRVDGIDPGTCEIVFPELDASSWHPA
jgi:hypothetical protein